VGSEYEQLLRGAYDAFSARDIDAAVALMHPDVDWPNAWEGGRARGHEAVRAYWQRQFAAIDPHVEPTQVTPAGEGRVAVEVHQVVRDKDGNLLGEGRVIHLYTIREGLIERMDVEEPAPRSS